MMGNEPHHSQSALEFRGERSIPALASRAVCYRRCSCPAEGVHYFLNRKSQCKERPLGSPRKCEECEQPLGVSVQKHSRLVSPRTQVLQRTLASGMHRFSPRGKLPVFLTPSGPHTVIEHRGLAVPCSSAPKAPL